MPPPPRTPKTAPQDANAALALFAKNLAEVERYHRRQATGHELGQHVISSLILADVHTALFLALEGKVWDPPS